MVVRLPDCSFSMGVFLFSSAYQAVFSKCLIDNKNWLDQFIQFYPKLSTKQYKLLPSNYLGLIIIYSLSFSSAIAKEACV